MTINPVFNKSSKQVASVIQPISVKNYNIQLIWDFYRRNLIKTIQYGY